jgi:hypothetical protein
MSEAMPDDLERGFRKSAPTFEARVSTESDCRAYWNKARWGGKLACAKCQSKRVWTIRDGTPFAGADYHHQTSLTSRTVLEKTGMALKMWFRAIFEVSARRTGISAKDLQRIIGFGSSETARTWLHKLRSVMVRSDSEPFGPFIEIEYALVGGRGGTYHELVPAAESGSRVLLVHTANDEAGDCRRFPEAEVGSDAAVTTDGHAICSATNPGDRPNNAIVQKKSEKRGADAVQACDWTISLLKRWLFGTHAGAVRPKRLRAYLDEFDFSHNRRNTAGVARIAACVIASVAAKPPLTMKALSRMTKPHRRFASTLAELA